MRVAFAVWDGRISPVFDVTRRVLLLDIEAGAVLERREEEFHSPDPRSRAGRRAARGVETLVCGALSGSLAGARAARGIRALAFVAGPVEEVLAAFLAGRIEDDAFAMPGCHGRCRRRRAGRSTEMPGRDGTGPEGKGPGTGRGMGRCGQGKGGGMGRGAGKGRGGGQGGGRGGGRGRGQGPGGRPAAQG